MGSVYPLWIEKLIFIGIIGLGIYLGIILQDYVSGPGLLLSWFCGLPLLILVTTEGIGRIIQSKLSD